MNGAELARALAAGEGVPEYKARRAVRFIVAQIADTMRAGGSVSLAGLGKFEVKQIEPREYVNPKDGTKVFKAQRRFGVTLKTSPRLFNNPPSVLETRAPVKWAGHVWAPVVQAFGNIEDQDDMATYDAVNAARIDASTLLPNAMVLAARALDQSKSLAVVDFNAYGDRSSAHWLGVARLRFSLWGLVNGQLQEQAAMMVNIDVAHNCGQYYWGLSGHFEATATGTALRWSVDWWDDVNPQRYEQTLVWTGTRLQSFELRVGYIPAASEADLPSVPLQADSHYCRTLAGTVKTVEV